MDYYCIDPQGVTKRHQEHLRKHASEAESWDTAKRNDWEYEEFGFPEHPLYVQSSVLRDFNCAYQSIFATLQLVSQCVLSGNLCINHEQIIDLLPLPHYVLYTLKKHYTRIPPHLFWGRPDFAFCDKGPLCLETNFSAMAGSQLNVSGIVHYYNNHPSRFLEIGSSTWMGDPMDCFSCVTKSIITNRSPLFFADVYDPKVHESRTRTLYEDMSIVLNKEYDLPTITGFVNDLKYDLGSVYYNDTKIDYVFTSMYTPDEYQFFSDFAPLLENIEKENVFALSSVMELLWSSKILFAIISEHLDSMPIPMYAKKNWRRYTPWTRVVRDGITDFNGQSISLPVLLKQNQESFVLKFCEVSGGRAVYIGKNVSSDKWNKLLEYAFSASPPRWVVQEYVESKPIVTLSKSDDCKLSEDEYEWIASPYFCMNHYAGTLIRLYFDDNFQKDFPIGSPTDFSTIAIY